MDNIEDEIANLIRELSLARRMSDRPREADILGDLGIIYSTKTKVTNIDKAIEYYNQAIPIYYDLQDWYSYYRSSHALGFIYSEIFDDFQKAKEIYDSAIEHGGSEYLDTGASRKRDNILREIKLLNDNKCASCGVFFYPRGHPHKPIHEGRTDCDNPDCRNEYCDECKSILTLCDDCHNIGYCPSCAPTQLKHCGSESCLNKYCFICIEFFSERSHCAGCGVVYCDSCFDKMETCVKCRINYYCPNCIDNGLAFRCPGCGDLYCKEHYESIGERSHCAGCGVIYCDNCFYDMEKCVKCGNNYYCSNCIDNGLAIRCPECSDLYCKEHYESIGECSSCLCKLD